MAAEVSASEINRNLMAKYSTTWIYKRTKTLSPFLALGAFKFKELSPDEPPVDLHRLNHKLYILRCYYFAEWNLITDRFKTKRKVPGHVRIPVASLDPEHEKFSESERAMLDRLRDEGIY
jgi:hypothetical protein